MKYLLFSLREKPDIIKGLVALIVCGLLCMECVRVPDNETPVTLSVSKESLSFAASGAQQTFTVTSNANCSVGCDASWITVSPSSFGSDNGLFFDSNEALTVTVTATDNSSTDPRTATIVISSSIPGVTEQTVSVTQAAANTNLSVSTSSLNFVASGERKSLTITSNAAWTVSSNQPWCTVQPTSGTGNGEITVNVTENAAGTPRTSTVTITAGNQSRQVNIEQVAKGEINVPVASVALNKSTLSLITGASETLTATIQPANATNKTVNWSSSNNSIATVTYDGTITAIAAGTATIIATTVDGDKTSTCIVTVNAPVGPVVPVTGITLNKNSTTLVPNGKETLIATIQPTNASNKTINWTSSNPSTAIVDNNGTITAIASGTATIIATTVDGGKTAICTVTVNPANVAVTGISLNKSTLTLNIGDFERLVPTITPSNATNQAVNWSSSNVSIATVANDGTVTAIAAGTATIIATTVDGGKTATCNVTVADPNVSVANVSLPATLLISGSETRTLTASILPLAATNKRVRWEIDDATVATLSVNTAFTDLLVIDVTSKDVGNATITVTTEDGRKTATCVVTVIGSVAPVVPVTSITLNKTSTTLEVNAKETLIATILPANATNKNITWSCSDASVATVDNTGTVTARAAGTTVITATSNGDNTKTATCVVTVNHSQSIAEPEMILVRGGIFTMGCNSGLGVICYENEKPAHQVTLSDFYIGKYEVTQAQWREVMGNNPSRFKGDNLPVESVSWHDVQEYITRLNNITGKKYRLPTEAEWEFAARGGNKSGGYQYSGSNAINDVAWYQGNSNQSTHPVGTKSSNELGIHDMTGNVWEWCSDWYGYYSSNAQINPQGPSSGSHRISRGSSWEYTVMMARVLTRQGNSPDTLGSTIGFRLACSAN